MELTMVLVLFAAGWSLSLALPVLLGKNTTDGIVTELTDRNETIFGFIEDANKDVVRPLIHGDIAFQISRSVKICNYCYWPASRDGTVSIPYVFSSAYSSMDKWLISQSMGQFELMTCLKFVERTTESDYISVESGNGCWSHMGRIGGKQVVNLSKTGCLGTGIVQHEFMHALGFLHEQSRSDRDKYVSINYQYINQGNWPNFNLENTNNLNLPYDYSSVMHYQSTEFSNTSGKPSIVPIPDPTVSLGQRIGMSHLDLMKVNKLYNCNVCRTKFLNKTGSFSSEGISFGPDGSCLWFIQTDYLNAVHLQLTDINIPLSPGCADSYIKIYEGYSKTGIVLLDKTCGNITLPPIISSQNSLLLEFVSNKDPALSSFNGVYKTLSYGRTLFRDGGIIISPYYGTAYPNNVDAEWSIIAPAPFRVNLIFSDFWVQDSINCSCDSLTVIDGSNATFPVLGTFCGSNKIAPLTSPGNAMIVKFHSDNQTSSAGFYLQYRFVIGQ